MYCKENLIECDCRKLEVYQNKYLVYKGKYFCNEECLDNYMSKEVGKEAMWVDLSEINKNIFKTKGNYRLLDIYNVCQDALNSVLSNDELVKKLMDIKLIKDNGAAKGMADLCKDIEAAIGNPLLNKVPDFWYTNILYYNIIELLKSRNTSTLPKSKKFILICSTLFQQPQAFKTITIGEKRIGYSMKIYSSEEAKKRNTSQWIDFYVHMPIYLVDDKYSTSVPSPEFYWDDKLNDFVCTMFCRNKY